MALLEDKSYELLIRDAMLERVKKIDWFKQFRKFSTNKSLQIQPQSIPFCGVYFIEGTGLPDGDSNVGETRFHTTARYGFSVIVQNNDPEKAEYQLDLAYQLLTKNLFNDPTLYGNPEAMIQAFIRNSRSHMFGAIGADNELPIAELRLDLTCDLGTLMFPPIVEDRLETLHIETTFPIGTTEQDSVQQVTAQYEIEFWSYKISSLVRGNSSLSVNAEVI